MQPVIGRVRDDFVQVMGDRPDILGNAPFVVVQNADKALRRVGDVVERLEGNAVGQRRVAKDTNHILVAAALIARRAHAERSRQRGAGVARAVTIVLAFSAERETVQTVGGADGVKAALAAGKEFVDVALMAHVPDEPVFWRREDAMQRDGQLHHAEVGAEVAAVFGKDGDEFVADFLGQLLQLVQLEFLDVFRAVHHVEVSVHRRRRKGLE